MCAEAMALNPASVEAVLRFWSRVDPGVFWGLSLVAALLFVVWTSAREGVSGRAIYWAGACAIFFGLWGGYLLGFAYYGTDGRPYAWLRFWSGGRAEYGGLLAGMLAIAVYLRIRGLPFLRYADALVPGVALGVSIGRLGCFLNGDDFGTRSILPWAVAFGLGTEAYDDHLSRGWIAPGDALSLSVHPVQIYASLFALVLFAVFSSWRPGKAGLRLAAFLVVYGVGRFLDQFLRGDFAVVLGPFSLTQVISVVLIGAGVGLSLYLRRSAAATTHYAGVAAHAVGEGAPLSASTVRDCSWPAP